MGWTYVRTVGLECVDLLRRYMQKPLPFIENASIPVLLYSTSTAKQTGDWTYGYSKMFR